MNVFQNIENYNPKSKCILTIGTFDGVGHPVHGDRGEGRAPRRRRPARAGAGAALSGTADGQAGEGAADGEAAVRGQRQW